MRTRRAPRTGILLGIVLTVMGGSRLASAQLLVDSDFNASSDSAALRANAAGQDWYESRQDVPTLLTLDSTNVGGNSTKKAKLTASTGGNAYLTQEFSAPQTQRFWAQWEIYVDSILDRPNSTYDRAALMFIGDDTGTDTTRKGPNAEDSERFVYLAFEKEGGGTSGTMNLVARENTFVTVAIGLSLKQWYTIKVMVDLTTGTYEVYVDGRLQGTVMAKTAKSSVTHISFAEWPSSEGAATFYVDNVTAQSTDNPSITLEPTTGLAGTTVTIKGSGFAPNTTGTVTFAGKSNPVTTSATGTFSTTMTVPSMSAGSYPVQADIPSGGAIETSATFTVMVPLTPTITLQPTSGAWHPENSLHFMFGGFAPGTPGRLFFDIDGDGNLDPDEPRHDTSIPSGDPWFRLVYVLVPNVLAGTYWVRADFPAGGPIEASATYTVTSSLSMDSRASGPVGKIIEFGGTGYPAEEEIGRAFFDSDRDGVLDAGEPSVILRTSLAGDITYATLTVPSVAPGDYPVRIDFPSGGSIEESRTFTVTQPYIIVNPGGGRAGTQVRISGFGFIPHSSGSVFFDTNNGRWDPLGEPGQTVTTDWDGQFTTGLLTVPLYWQPGYYFVFTDIPGDGGPVIVYAQFLLIP